MKRQELNILIEQETKQLTQYKIKWLNEVVDGKWEYENGVVNVKGGVNMVNEGLTSIPVQFGEVSEYFRCYVNNLTSLKGSPTSVGGDFRCNSNELTSLVGGPTSVGGYFSCVYNHLTSLAGGPTSVGGHFDCYNNPLILCDELFLQLRLIGKSKIGGGLRQLKDQIPIQFGVTNKRVINKIWQSYMNILEGKN